MPITPDTKDWTWVLDRPCGECGYHADAFARENFGQTIRDNAEQWQKVLEHEDVRVRPNDDRWSALEYACHVRDVYRVFGERLRLMLDEEGPAFQNWDQDESAREDRYDLQNPAIVSGELADASTAYAQQFDGVQGAQWDRPGTRSNGSHFTVLTLGLYGLHDPMHHLWDVNH